MTNAVSYTDYCVHCRRATVWLLRATVNNQQVYECVRCQCPHVYEVTP